MDFFTADTHFGHQNIIKYCGRPFRCTREMDETMIENWNRVVGPEDTVYHIGDFMLGPRQRSKELLARLAGKRKVLIRGNHDRTADAMREIGFYEVLDRMPYIARQGGWGRPILLVHNPNDIDIHHGMPVLCGHVHEKWLRRGRCINVGVDVWGFTPQRLDTILNAPIEQAGSHSD